MSSLRRWDPEPGRVADRQGANEARDWTNWPSLYDQLGCGPWMDLYETDDDVVIQVALPGVDPDAIDVSVTDQTVSIQGEMKPEDEDQDRRYVHRERRFGRFHRTVALPSNVEGSKAEATYERGILTLTIPKEEKVRPRRIAIKAK